MAHTTTLLKYVVTYEISHDKKVGILVLQKLSSHLLTSEINDNLNLLDEEKIMLKSVWSCQDYKAFEINLFCLGLRKSVMKLG